MSTNRQDFDYLCSYVREALKGAIADEERIALKLFFLDEVGSITTNLWTEEHISIIVEILKG